MNNKFTLTTVYGTVRSNKLYSHNGIRYNLNPVIIDNATGYFNNSRRCTYECERNGNYRKIMLYK